MGIPKIESHQIQDLSLLDEINEHVNNTDWYAMTERNDAYEQAVNEGILTETKHAQLKKIHLSLIHISEPTRPY